MSKRYDNLKTADRMNFNDACGMFRRNTKAEFVSDKTIFEKMEFVSAALCCTVDDEWPDKLMELEAILELDHEIPQPYAEFICENWWKFCW